VYENICKIKIVNTIDEANELLRDGWILLRTEKITRYSITKKGYNRLYLSNSSIITLDVILYILGTKYD